MVPVHAKTITIMVGGMEKRIYLPAILTEKLGYFKDAGLDVELSDEQAGIGGADAMIAGEVQGVVDFCWSPAKSPTRCIHSPT